MEKQAQALASVDNLYVYMMTRLTEANIKTDPNILDEVSSLLTTVKEGWDAIGDQQPAL
jgi:flagellar protein FliS